MRQIRRSLGTLILLALAGPSAARADDPVRVGPAPGGDGTVVPTRQVLRPAGRALEFGGRPVDLAPAPGGKALYAKDNRGLVVIDPAGWRLVQELPFPEKGGGSMHGLAVSADGSRVFATDAADGLHEARVGEDGRLSWSRRIAMPGPGGKGLSYGCGVALSADGATAYVCLSRNNSLGVVDLTEGRVVREIAVGVAPFDVVLADEGRTAFVSNWGGRHPKAGEKTAPSSETPVPVDDRGVAKTGTVGKVDLAEGRMVAEAAVGLHPSDLALDPEGRRLYVANANSDTVSAIDAAALRVEGTIAVRPRDDLPFGSAPNALALSGDGRTLFVANGGNNAVAVVRLGEGEGPGRVEGFIPTAWYPGALATEGGDLFVANVKGFGSRREAREDGGRSVYAFQGVVSKVAIPDRESLAALTAQVEEDARVPQILRAREKAERAEAVKPVPVPKRLGEPSVFDHVIYVIKENRTYDQVFGDIAKGDGDPKLCLFGREVTPNHHALAEQFVLLDNFYCNGVLSADGHAWATEGNVTDYLEKSFGGFTRSYTFGDDPLSYSSSGFLWDNVLARGISFRNYGEMAYTEPEPKDATFPRIYEDYRSGRRQIPLTQKIGVENLRRYSSPTYPGWNMNVPDVLRADAFLAELKGFEEGGDLPNLVILYLPQDHTSGTTAGMPTPRAHMADNDLAVGRVVEAVSKSRFWPKTCIFVIEDDPQDGFDHVDGHRSLCLVASPYSKRGAVVSEFYNQTSVLHTMERILGCPPMNQMDAMSPLMTACFAEAADLTPYRALTPEVPLDELNPPVARLDGPARDWARRSAALDLALPDRADEDELNRILWHAVKGVDARYPRELAGAHGRGLKSRRLIFGGEDEEEEDDD